MKVILVAVILVVSCDLSYTAGILGMPDLESLLKLNTSQLNAFTSLNNNDTLNALLASLGNGTTDDVKDMMDVMNNLSNSPLNTSSLPNPLNSSQTLTPPNLTAPGTNDLAGLLSSLENGGNTGLDLSNLLNSTNPAQTSPDLAGLLNSLGNGGGSSGLNLGNLLDSTNPAQTAPDLAGLLSSLGNGGGSTGLNLGNLLNSTNPASQAGLANLFSSLQKPMTPQNLQNIGNIFQNLGLNGQNGGFTFGPTQNALLQTMATFLGITPSDQKILEEFFKNVAVGKYTPLDLLDPYSEARPAVNVYMQFVGKQTEAAVRNMFETTLLLLFLLPHF